MSSQQNTFKQRLTHCLSCSICSLVKKPRAKPVFTSRLPLLFGLYNLYTNHSGQGDGERERADAISCVFNFDLWNAKVIEVWKNFPDIWHRHGLGRLSLPEVLHHLHSENTEKNKEDWNHKTESYSQIFFPLVASVRICAHTHQQPLGLLVQSMSKFISTVFGDCNKRVLPQTTRYISVNNGEIFFQAILKQNLGGRYSIA